MLNKYEEKLYELEELYLNGLINKEQFFEMGAKYMKLSKKATQAKIYVRGNEPLDIEMQILDCKEYAENKGYEVGEIYIDEKKTGSNMNREGLQTMLNDLVDGDVVLVAKPEKLSRNVEDFLHIGKTIENKGAKLTISNIDNDAVAKFYKTLLYAIAELFEENNQDEKK